MSELPALSALCAQVGVESRYVGYDGRTCLVSVETQRALLHALGFDASSEARAQECLHALQAAVQPGMLGKVGMITAGAPGRPRVEVQLSPDHHGDVHYGVRLELEDDRHFESGGHSHGAPRIALYLPERAELPCGYHRLRATLHFHGRSVESEQTLIVTPGRCVSISELIGTRRALGLWTHVYALRSRDGWGVGDLRDLRTLLSWAGSHGLELLGINPLHATDPRAAEVSPYFPSSRLYRSPIYLDVEGALSAIGAQGTASALLDPELREQRARLQARARIDYAAVHALKRKVLQAAHDAYLREGRSASDPLTKAYTRFRRQEGQPLQDFARFCALSEQQLAKDPNAGDFHAWPAELRDPRSAAVAAFAHEQREAVDLHAFTQFLLDQQLAECRRAGERAGMAVGLYGDLALGDAPGSADIWAAPERYAQGASVGAPPDAYSERGQEWGLVPLNPLRMRDESYRGFSQLMRHAFAHMGMLRLDHVMGLCRQFWIPSGGRAQDGGYVRFPLDELLGVVALESRRARAVLVGEDLGVVPDGLREELASRNILRSQVLYFERSHDGGFVHPSHYAQSAFVTLGTHDLPTLAGYVEGRDLHVRRKAGNLQNDAELDHTLGERAQATRRLCEALRAEGLLPEQPDPPSLETLNEAVHRWLAGASSRLVGLSLDDLTLEPDALNTPAASIAEAPNWSRRSQTPLETLATDARIATLLRHLRARIWPR